MGVPEHEGRTLYQFVYFWCMGSWLSRLSSNQLLLMGSAEERIATEDVLQLCLPGSRRVVLRLCYAGGRGTNESGALVE